MEMDVLSHKYKMAFLKVDTQALDKGKCWWGKKWTFQLYHSDRVWLNHCRFIMLKYSGDDDETHYDCICHKKTKKIVFPGYDKLPDIVKQLLFVRSKGDNQIAVFSPVVVKVNLAHHALIESIKKILKIFPQQYFLNHCHSCMPTMA